MQGHLPENVHPFVRFHHELLHPIEDPLLGFLTPHFTASICAHVQLHPAVTWTSCVQTNRIQSRRTCRLVSTLPVITRQRNRKTPRNYQNRTSQPRPKSVLQTSTGTASLERSPRLPQEPLLNDATALFFVAFTLRSSMQFTQKIRPASSKPDKSSPSPLCPRRNTQADR